MDNVLVYQHRRLDTNEVFYVGIGIKRRPYSKYNRNKYWHHIVNKCGYEVEILFQDISWEEACQKEKELIKKYGRKDLKLGSLVNLTDGGDGTYGIIISEEARKKMSEYRTGRHIHSEERKKFMSESQIGHIVSEETRKKIGEANRNPSEETRKKMSESRKNIIISDETRKKLSKAGKNRVWSDETREKMSKVVRTDEWKVKIGKAHKGKNISEETRKKMSESKKNISEETRKKMSLSAKLRILNNNNKNLKQFK